MTLEKLGYNAEWEEFRKRENLDALGVGRVVSEHKERYRVRTGADEFDAEVIGNLRFSAKDRSDFPVVGDWVAVSPYDEGKLLIYKIFPRKTVLERAAAGKPGEKQIIASNIDSALIVQGLDRDFNLNRVERYLTLVYQAGIRPVLVLSKADLVSTEDLSRITERVKERLPHLNLVTISNKNNFGYNSLFEQMIEGETSCLLGSSGVGKSTLINNLSGVERMKTGPVSSNTGKGKHVTSHRELIVLENGAILIDNPGMREVGIGDATEGFESAFDQIITLSDRCRYKNCTHVHEEGCAVLEAVERGEIDRGTYNNYLRILKEKIFFESTVEERRRKDKDLGKLIKNYKKQINKKDT